MTSISTEASLFIIAETKYITFKNMEVSNAAVGLGVFYFYQSEKIAFDNIKVVDITATIVGLATI